MLRPSELRQNEYLLQAGNVCRRLQDGVLFHAGVGKADADHVADNQVTGIHGRTCGHHLIPVGDGGAVGKEVLKLRKLLCRDGIEGNWDAPAAAVKCDLAVVLLTGAAQREGKGLTQTGIIYLEVQGFPVNGVLGMVSQWQTLFFGHRYSQTTLDRGPDFMKLADAYGLEGTRVDNIDDFAAAFEKAYAAGKPCIIECMLDIDEMVAPMVAPGSPIDSFCLN